MKRVWLLQSCDWQFAVDELTAHCYCCLMLKAAVLKAEVFAVTTAAAVAFESYSTPLASWSKGICARQDGQAAHPLAYSPEIELVSSWKSVKQVSACCRSTLFRSPRVGRRQD